jgi:hypothetical protein
VAGGGLRSPPTLRARLIARFGRPKEPAWNRSYNLPAGACTALARSGVSWDVESASPPDDGVTAGCAVAWGINPPCASFLWSAPRIPANHLRRYAEFLCHFPSRMGSLAAYGKGRVAGGTWAVTVPLALPAGMRQFPGL